MHQRFNMLYGELPDDPSSPSSHMQHMGASVSFGLVNGMEHGIKQAVYKTEAAARLQTRPLWKIAISDRRIHAEAYDARIVNDKRVRMRDRAELKSRTGFDEWGDPVRFAIFDEVAHVDWDKLELGEID
jgi:hypothetical protein